MKVAIFDTNTGFYAELINKHELHRYSYYSGDGLFGNLDFIKKYPTRRAILRSISGHYNLYKKREFNTVTIFKITRKK